MSLIFCLGRIEENTAKRSKYIEYVSSFTVRGATAKCLELYDESCNYTEMTYFLKTRRMNK